MSNQVLRTVGFPRSGNTFLNYALRDMYFPNEEININWHTVSSLDRLNRSIVPLRNPLDCIASWHKYPSQEALEADVKYYLRFHNAVASSNNSLTLLVFDVFTMNLGYIAERIEKDFGIVCDNIPTVESVKDKMVEDGKVFHLPQNNRTEIERIQGLLKDTTGYQDCIALYNSLTN